MKKKLTSNWLLKVASLVFAFCLWLIVINIEDPTDPQSFSNISVKFENADVLTNQGLVYEVLDGTSMVKSITVYGPRSIVEQLKDEDIIAKADFNDLTNANTIPIEFSTSRFGDRITKIKGNISTVKLNIEQEKTIRLVLRVNAVGEIAEGYQLGRMTPDQNQIIITGPESIINQIDKAVAEVDVTDATGDIATYADVKLFDAEGATIESDALTQKVTSVRVSVEVLATKTVPLSFTVMGTPANGYMQTGVVESNPSEVTIAGSASTLNGIGRIEIPAEELNVTGQSTNMMTTVNIKEFLPGNVILADSDFSGRVSVTVFIEEEKSKTLTVNTENIRILNTPEDFTVEFVDLDERIEVLVTGLADVLDQISADNIIGYVDVEDILEAEGRENLRSGTYATELKWNLPDGVTIERVITVEVAAEKMEDS